MTDPKPSTNDILSKIRAKAAAAAAAPESDSKAEAPAPSAAPAEDAAAVVAPKSPADIMAAIRAKAGTAPAAAKPGGTADILAAAKKPAATAPASAAAKSPADIMAAIRAKAGAAPAAAASQPAAGDAVAAVAPAPKIDPSKAAGLSAADMIKAARTKTDGGPPVPKVVLPAKPLPGKVGAAEVGRRSMLTVLVGAVCSWVVLAWTSVIGASIISLLGTARFMMPNVLVEPPTKFKIGPPNDYAPGTVSTKWQAQFNIWVVNAEVDGAQVIYALSTVCTHLGCTPNWLEGEQKFKCPCHGSGFYKSGVNFEGPAPRPLERVGLRLAEDGMLEVDKSVKFQKELGQWVNASSFVAVT
jgi:cytochrome b6-f complex iron-sulfur subunit